MSCNQKRIVLHQAKNRTRNPIPVDILHTDESVGADTPLVDGAKIALVDVREV